MAPAERVDVVVRPPYAKGSALIPTRGPCNLKTPRAVKGSLVRGVCALLAAHATPLTAQQPVERPAWCAKLPRPAYASLPRVSVPSNWFEVYRVDPDVYAIY